MAALAALWFVSTAQGQCVGYTLDSPPAFASAGRHVVAVADMNGDGTPDLVSSGSVFFDFKQEVALVGEARTIADLDRDGRPDIVAIVDGQIAALMNNGNGTFTLRKTSLPNDDQVGVNRLSVADFNGDGIPDLVSGVTPEFAAGDGAGGFGAPTVVAPTGAEAIVSGDFDGDGKRDVAVFYSGSLTTRIFAGQGNGTFVPDRTIFGPAYRLFSADFDRDGRDDIIGSSTRTGAGPIEIAWGNAAIAPSLLPDPAGNRLTDSVIPVAVGDVNKDGAPDIVANVTHFTAAETTNETVVFLNDGRGEFSVTFRRPEAFDGTFADFDGDGNLDLVSSGFFLRGNGNGTFRDVGHILGIPADFGAAADLDGDGDDDIVLRSTDAGTTAPRIAILWRESSGGFLTQVIDDPRVTRLAGTGDVNGDGRAELLVYSGAFLEAVDIDRSGAVQTIASVPVSFFGTQVVTGHFRGNGSTEFAMLTNTDVQILDPNGPPSPRALLKLGDSDSHRFAVADVNGDGRDDVIVAGRGKSDCLVLPCTFKSGGFLSLYLSTGSGFTSERQLVSKPESFLGSPAIGDFNGDGRIDIAAVALSGGVVLLLGDGTGNFAIGSAPLLPAIDAAAADLNHDGITDLIAWRESSLTVLLGSRSGFITGGTFLSAPLNAQVLFPRRPNQPYPDIAVTQSAADDLLLITARCANRLRAVGR